MKEFQMYLLMDKHWDILDLYLTKLDTLSDTGAALAACLGKATNCCQYLGGAGSSCVIHGIESENSGFYVLFKGNAQTPSWNDEVLAQSWVWRGDDGQLCFDSIEKSQDANSKVVISMFRLLGHILCQKFNIPSVNVGAESGISSQVGFTGYPSSKTRLLQYEGYSDANTTISTGA